MSVLENTFQETRATFVRVIHHFPKGSIWQTRYLSLPFTLVVTTLSFSHATLSYGEKAAWFVFGILAWTLLEYIIHRWIFHYQPRTQVGIALLERLHILHHGDPKDQTQVCIPFLLSVPMWAWIFANLVLVGGDQAASLLFTCGLAVGMTVYDITHFSTHYMNAPNVILRSLKKQHMLHHFSDHNLRFGVTSPLWDYVFRTYR